MKTLFKTNLFLICLAVVMCCGPDPYEGMVLIEAGEFQMGSNSGNSDEKPIHSVHVDAFYMDAYEVTYAEYAEFLNAKGKYADGSITWLDIGSRYCRIEYVNRVYRAKAGYENHPVGEVSWYGAMGLCGVERQTSADRGGMGEGCAWKFIGSKLPVGQRDRFHECKLQFECWGYDNRREVCCEWLWSV